jgi:hypothetical protein
MSSDELLEEIWGGALQATSARVDSPELVLPEPFCHGIGVCEFM